MGKRTRLQKWFSGHSDMPGGFQAFEQAVMSRKWAEEDEEGYRGYDPHAPKKATVPRYFWWCIRNWVWYYTKHQVNKLICKRRGHAIVDVSTAGPDSGDMAWECRRCGESGSTTLY